MEKYFKTVEGKYVNIVKHTLEQLNKWDDLRIYVGTDSQSESDFTMYATTICFRYGNRGAHYIVFKEKVPRVRVEYMRLYDEGLRTLAASKFLNDELQIFPFLEFDYADVKKTVSSNLVSVFKGYQNARFKSEEMIATRAANHECRKESNMFNLEEALKQAA
jgi:predicted RNase H-related nuclease YkuK (DUF458 family)